MSIQETQKTQKTQQIHKTQQTQQIHKTMPLRYMKNTEGHFVCPTCGVTKRRQNSMHYHMKKHIEEVNHLCGYCNKSFLQKQTLDLHLKSKHAQENHRAFSCPFQGCDFQSHTKGNCVIHCLRVHFQEEILPYLQYHPENRSYSCTHCIQPFPSTSAFYYHIKKCIPFDKSSAKYRLLHAIL